MHRSIDAYIDANYAQVPDVGRHDPCSNPCASVGQETEGEVILQFGEAMTEQVFPESENKSW